MRSLLGGVSDPRVLSASVGANQGFQRPPAPSPDAVPGCSGQGSSGPELSVPVCAEGRAAWASAARGITPARVRGRVLRELGTPCVWIPELAPRLKGCESSLVSKFPPHKNFRDLASNHPWGCSAQMNQHLQEALSANFGVFNADCSRCQGHKASTVSVSDDCKTWERSVLKLRLNVEKSDGDSLRNFESVDSVRLRIKTTNNLAALYGRNDLVESVLILAQV